MNKGTKNRKKHAGRANRSKPSWFAMGAVGLAAYSVAGGQLTPSAQAGQITRNWSVNMLTQNIAMRHFEIDPGPLSDVIAKFQTITGMRVTLSREGIGALPSPGVKGDYTADRALQMLLAGTMVSSRFVGTDAIVLDVKAASTSVDVTAAAPAPSPSSPKYTEPLREVPQSIAIIPRAVMEQQGAVTLSDAMRNVPGITLQAGEGGGASSTTGDMFNMRGANASNSLFVDGVRDDGLVSRNVYNLEQVEVFLGPTGSDVGRGTASGYVNMQTKTPRLMTDYSATFGYDSAGQKRGSLDLNQPIRLGSPGSWLGRAAARLNAIWQQGGVPGRDVITTKNRSIAPSVAVGLGTATRVTFGSQITRQNNMPDYGIPGAAWAKDLLTATTVHATQPVDQTNYYGSPAFDFDRVSQDSHTVRIEHDVNDGLTLRHQARYNKTHRNAVITGLGAFAPATQTVTLTRQGNERENRIASSQSSVVGRLTTGALNHAVSGSLEYTYEDQFAPTIGGAGARGPVDIYNPNPLDPVVGYAPARTGAFTKGWTNTVAFYAFDTVNFGERWQLSGGLRWEHYNTNFRQISVTGLATTDQRAADSLVGGKAGLLYRMTNAGNVYFSYGTSATPPGTANFTLSAQVNNQNNPNVEPQESTNYEVGSKWDFFQSRLSMTGSVFQTDNKNVIFTVDATAAPPIFNQDDAQRVRGVSFSATGQATNRLQLLLNLGYLDTELQTQNSVNNGKRLTLTPPFSGSLWATYLLPRGISVGGGVRHTDRAFVNAANTIQVPASNVVDAVADYPVNEHLTLRMNVYNVTNGTYLRSVNNNGNRYNPGAPRTVMMTSAIRF